MLFVSARWFFDDLETFLGEIGYRAHDDIWWKLLRISAPSPFIWVKIVGFLGTYAIVVGLTYASISRVMH